MCYDKDLWQFFLQQKTLKFHSFNKPHCRNAESYFKVQMDARSLCRLAALLRNNHTAISVSSFPTEHAKVDHMIMLPMTICDNLHQPIERAQLIGDHAPFHLQNHQCSRCGIMAWFHMVRMHLKKNTWYMDNPHTVQFEGQLSVQGKKLCSMENLWRHENYLEGFLAKGQRQKGKRESDRTVRSMGGRLDPALFQGTSQSWRCLFL